MYASEKEMKKQLEFCQDLASRLKVDGHRHTVLVADIKRLRRELMELVHMTEWDYHIEKR